MNRKKTTKLKIFIVSGASALAVGLVATTTDVGKFYLNKYDNPYLHKEIELANMTEEEKYKTVTKFIKDMEKYETIEVMYDLDPDNLKEAIKNLLMSNPYTDFKMLSDRLATTEVSYDDSLSGGVRGKTMIEENAFYERVVIKLLEPNSEIYFHELIHAIYPTIKDCQFLEETISAQLTSEFYHTEYDYDEPRMVLKMWLETLGSDVFNKIRATGSLEPLKEELENIGCGNEMITIIISDFNDYFSLYKIYKQGQNIKDETLPKEIYDASGEINLATARNIYDSKCLHLLQNIEYVYQLKYQDTMLNNEQMKLYQDEFMRLRDTFSYFTELEETYYFNQTMKKVKTY